MGVFATDLEYIDSGRDAYAEAELAPCCMSHKQLLLFSVVLDIN